MRVPRDRPAGPLRARVAPFRVLYEMTVPLPLGYRRCRLEIRPANWRVEDAYLVCVYFDERKPGVWLTPFVQVDERFAVNDQSAPTCTPLAARRLSRALLLAAHLAEAWVRGELVAAFQEIEKCGSSAWSSITSAPSGRRGSS